MTDHPGTGAEPHPGAAAFVDYFRCPEQYVPLRVRGECAPKPGFFRLGSTFCYGRTSAGHPADSPAGPLVDAAPAAELSRGSVALPFHLADVVENLRRERYLAQDSSQHFLHAIYYLVRPLLALPIRSRVQRQVARWRTRSIFPRWPVDCSVDQIFRSVMGMAAQAGGGQVPFIWFWPHGRTAALMMTHDVEQEPGAQQCGMLMDLDDSFRVKSSFQLVPEGRYPRVETLVREIRARGFEPNIHDLNHDGNLYQNRPQFQERVGKINEYARRYGCKGFRAGSMHRNQEWFDLFAFEYDMSVPCVSQLEPQRGGCCTVMPYFVGDILELPLTTVQDHGLFYILRERSIALWKQQADIVTGHNGLISFIVHPDYLDRPEHRQLYQQLLAHITTLRDERDVWVALPGDINEWWRRRRRMRLVQQHDRWHIEGEGAESAAIAFAQVVDGQVVYRLNLAPSPRGTTPTVSGDIGAVR